jgi:signal peptidase II
VRRIFLTAWTIWLFDFATKQWAISALDGEPKQILGSFLQLTLVKNPGAAFGFATGLTLLYSILAVLVVATIVYFARAISSGGWQLTAGLLLGGVMGNLADRAFREPSFFRGHVIDWIELPNWPVFNLADSAIVIAAAIAFVLSVKNVPPITPVR